MIVTLPFQPLHAQIKNIGTNLKDDLVKGDAMFKDLAFEAAIVAYENALKEQPENGEIKIKLAECNHMLNNPDKVVVWYDQAKTALTTADKKHKLYYAEALSTIGRYDEAVAWYRKFDEANTDDKRPPNKIAGIESKEKFLKNRANVEITEAKFNSKTADFSPAYLNGGVVFVTGRKESGLIKRKFAWDNSNFLELIYAKESEDSGEQEYAYVNRRVNSKYHEGPVTFWNDGKQMIFTRNNFENGKKGTSKDGISKLKLYQAERQSGDDTWSSPTALPFNNDEYSVGHPTISSNGSILYFSSDMPGGIGGTDLYTSKLVDGVWQTPENLGPNINTEGNEMFPFLLNDNELYFSSNGREGLGGLDLYGINLEKGLDSKITNLGAPLNSSYDDFGMAIHDSGIKGYFSSNREGGAGNDDIYRFMSEKPLLMRLIVKGIVKDEHSGEPVEGAIVKLLDGQGNELGTVVSTAGGYYEFDVEEKRSYSLEGDKDKYFPGKNSFSTINEAPDGQYSADIKLVKDSGFSLFGLITERESKAVIPGVEVKIRDNQTGKDILVVNTGEEGTFRKVLENKKLNERLDYQISLNKKGYLGKSFLLETKLSKPGQVNVHEFLDFQLDKLELGTDIGKLIEINPIYFDLNKFNIRADASEELDKIVKVMLENPTLVIELGSHTDSRGSDAYNSSLSDKRAKASAGYVVSKGIEKDRIYGKGYGETQLINKCKNGVKCSKEEHQLNRRTEFKVVKF